MYVLKYSRTATEPELMKHILDQELFKNKFCLEIREKSDESLVVDTKSRRDRRTWPLHKTPLLSTEDLNHKISGNNGCSFGEPYEARNCTVRAGNKICIY